MSVPYARVRGPPRAGSCAFNLIRFLLRWRRAVYIGCCGSSIAPIIEFCDVCVTSKGIYVKPGLNPPAGERKLYLLIEGNEERNVKAAVAQVQLFRQRVRALCALQVVPGRCRAQLRRARDFIPVTTEGRCVPNSSNFGQSPACHRGHTHNPFVHWAAAAAVVTCVLHRRRQAAGGRLCLTARPCASSRLRHW